jgi:hypothetical protein
MRAFYLVKGEERVFVPEVHIEKYEKMGYKLESPELLKPQIKAEEKSPLDLKPKTKKKNK